MFVVVGDVSRKDIEAKLAALESLPQGNFGWPKVEHITPVTDQYMFIPKPADFAPVPASLAAAGADLVIAERAFALGRMPTARFYSNRIGSWILSSFIGKLGGYSQGALTIEHLMPQSWREHWSAGVLDIDGSVDQELAEQRNRLVHTIGNLTLVTSLVVFRTSRRWVYYAGGDA